MSRFAQTLLVLCALLALPAPALARGVPAGTDEYVLDIPGAGGNRPAADAGGGAGGEAPLPPAATAALQDQGPDGAAAAELAKATGPKADGAEATDGGDGGSDDSQIAPLIGEVGGSEPGVGLILPVILGLTLIGAAATWIVRRRGERSAGV